MKYKDFFLLSWRKLGVIVVTGFASFILHNLISGLIGMEEPLFFVIVVIVIPAYTLIAVSFTLVSFVIKRK